MRRALGGAAVCFLAALAPVSAQAIRGRVVLPDSVTPLAGVIVVIKSAEQATTSRALTNARGQFTSAPLTPGRYTIELLRIGYRPSPGPPVDVAAGGTANVQIVFSAPPISLTAVNVRERATCQVSADSGMAVARLWEEARMAMLGAQLADAGGAPLVAEWIEYDRILDPSARAVLELHVRAARHPTAHAFHSRPAEELASKGYVVSDGKSTTYYAPDADVLLSESFAATHCFRVQRAPPGRSNEIGVGFVPAPNRRDVSDIEGTFWLDASTSELASLEFRYTGLADVLAAADAGGRVEFLRLADGEWLVRRWSVRMPQFSAADRSAAMSGIPGVPASRSPVVRAVQVTGGEVSRVTRSDSVAYQASGPSLAVQVTGAVDSTYPAAGAVLALDGTGYRATADAAGMIRLSPVLAGRYRVRLTTPLMDSLRVPAVAGEVEVREDAHVDTLKLPPPSVLLAAVCPRDSVRHGEGMLYGRVRDERARAIDGAVVTATWQGDFAVVGTDRGDALNFRERSLGTFSGGGGFWRVCGVPRGTSILVRVASDSGTDRQTVRLDSARAFVAVDLVAHHEVAALNREAKAALGEIQRQTALVELSVSSADGTALPDVRLDVRLASGSQTLVTGPTGRALLPSVVPGELTVQARRIGFLPGKVAARVAAGRNTVPIILSPASLPRLDTVRVLGDRRVLGLMRNDEFDTRRLNRAATASITRDDIVRRNPVDLWQMLTNVPSIRIVDSASVTAQSTRSDLVSPSGVRVPCYISVMVDGIVKNPLGDAFDLRDLPRPDEVYGIEVFAGSSSIPLQYGGTGSGKWCGMIAVWTR